MLSVTFFDWRDRDVASGSTVQVWADSAVQDYKRRPEKAGVDTRYTDHGGVYHSLYFTDSDGLNLEITYKPPLNAELEGKPRKIVREMFNKAKSVHSIAAAIRILAERYYAQHQ